MQKNVKCASLSSRPQSCLAHLHHTETRSQEPLRLACQTIKYVTYVKSTSHIWMSHVIRLVWQTIKYVTCVKSHAHLTRTLDTRTLDTHAWVTRTLDTHTGLDILDTPASCTTDYQVCQLVVRCSVLQSLSATHFAVCRNVSLQHTASCMTDYQVCQVKCACVEYSVGTHRHTDWEPAHFLFDTRTPHLTRHTANLEWSVDPAHTDHSSLALA